MGWARLPALVLSVGVAAGCGTSADSAEPAPAGCEDYLYPYFGLAVSPCP